MTGRDRTGRAIRDEVGERHPRLAARHPARGARRVARHPSLGDSLVGPRVRFAIRPGALRVRLPPHASGLSPTARELRRRARLRALGCHGRRSAHPEPQTRGDVQPEQQVMAGPALTSTAGRSYSSGGPQPTKRPSGSSPPASGSSTVTSVPPSRGLSRRMRPPMASRRSLRPSRPLPRVKSAPPMPSSRTEMRRMSSTHPTSTVTAEAFACFAALVSVSATT